MCSEQKMRDIVCDIYFIQSHSPILLYKYIKYMNKLAFFYSLIREKLMSASWLIKSQSETARHVVNSNDAADGVFRVLFGAVYFTVFVFSRINPTGEPLDVERANYSLRRVKR